MGDAPPFLTSEQRTALLALARAAICAEIRGTRLSAIPPDDPVLQAPGAAFVTLRHGQALRGCIGYIHALKPLAETVMTCAVSAAKADPRFSPVRPDELSALTLEISVLSPLVAVRDPGEIEVGRHGLLVSRAGRQGLLLPQVATEFGWDREAFLSHTCQKAGLPPHAWREGADIRSFTVDHFTDQRPVG